MATAASELVWRFAGQARKHAEAWDLAPAPCEACGVLGLNVWRRVGVPEIDLLRCWGHGPGQDGRACDGPKL